MSLAADSAEAGLWTLDYSTGAFWATERARADLWVFARRGPLLGAFRGVRSIPTTGISFGAPSSSQRARANPSTVEYRILPDDGRVRWIASRGRLRFKSTGGPERLTGISIDITERKRREAEAERSAEVRDADLRPLLEVHQPAFRRVDRAIEDALRRVCELLGIDLAVLWQGTAEREPPSFPRTSTPIGRIRSPPNR